MALRIFNMNEKNVIARFLFLNPPPRQLFKIFSKMVRDISRDLLLNTIFRIENVKDDEFFMCAKFWFSSIICAEVLANKSFSKGKSIRFSLEKDGPSRAVPVATRATRLSHLLVMAVSLTSTPVAT